MTAPAPTVITADFDTHANFQSILNRKAVTGAAFIGYADETPRLTKVVAPNGQFLRPSTMRSGGRVSDDGFEFNTEVKMTEQRGMGSYAVLRRDMMTKDFTTEWSFLETSKLSLAVSNGLDLRSRVMSSDGEFRFAHPDNQQTVYFSVFIVGRDRVGALPFFMGKYYPYCTMTAKSKESWQDKTEGLPRAITLGADQDPVLKTPLVEYIWGPGALAVADQMGIEVSTEVAA